MFVRITDVLPCFNMLMSSSVKIREEDKVELLEFRLIPVLTAPIVGVIKELLRDGVASKFEWLKEPRGSWSLSPNSSSLLSLSLTRLSRSSQ